MASVRRVAAAIATCLALWGATWGCTRSGPPALQVGVDRSLKSLGLARFLVAGFEEETKQRASIRYGGTDELLAWANQGDLDVVLMVSEDALSALEAEGLPLRSETYAHEELVLIGPFNDLLGRFSAESGARLLQNVLRTNYRFLKGKPGSVERARYDRLFRLSGDRLEPGSAFNSDVEGAPLVKRAIKEQAFALVRRSSLLQSVVDGKRPHRVYKEQDPALVLRLVLAEIHPGKTGRPTRPEFFDYVMGSAGQDAVAAFGKDKFGYPLFAAGPPADGQGARVPGLKDDFVAEPPP